MAWIYISHYYKDKESGVGKCDHGLWAWEMLIRKSKIIATLQTQFAFVYTPHLGCIPVMLIGWI